MLGAIRTTRRRFFGLAGAAPLAAKAAADAEIAKLAGLMEGRFSAPPRLYSGVPDGVGLGRPSWADMVSSAARHVELFGLPEFVEREFRRQAALSCSLDPDIACKRSWSMSVKLMTQRQRNYDRLVADVQGNAKAAAARAGLNKFLGFEWPW